MNEIKIFEMQSLEKSERLRQQTARCFSAVRI